MNVTRREFTRRASLIALGSLTGAQFAKANITYTVQNGDTLGQIARVHGISVSQLKNANQLSGDLIRVRQTLLIPEEAAPAHRPAR